MTGARHLSDLRGRRTHLRLTCTRCEREEVVSLDAMAELYGWAAPLPDVRHHLARDCPNRGSSIYDRCDPVIRRA